MERKQRTARLRVRVTALAVTGLSVGLVTGCGEEEDYKNRPRPPAPINITASVNSQGVSVSPAEFGAGPIVLIVTNQTDSSQEVTFETDELGGDRPGITQTTEPINPEGTGQLKVDVPEGRYRVRVSDDAIRPASIRVDSERPSAQNEVLQP
jgi:hypothetical protein